MKRFIMKIMFERCEMFECRISDVTVGNLMISRIFFNLMMLDNRAWCMLVVVNVVVLVVNEVVLMVCLWRLVNIMICVTMVLNID